MATEIHPATGASTPPEKKEVEQVILYGHSALFYWWPLWVAGYVMALLTWIDHAAAPIGDKQEWFFPSRNLGAIYTCLLLLLIVITSSHVRGMKAALLILSLCFVALLVTYLDWWHEIMGFVGHEHVYMNFSFYVFSSTILCAAWLVTVFLIDRLSFWRFRPGQITHEHFGGIVDKSYDTDNMILVKRQDELFRHWIIGLGSGDLHMQTMGGRGVEMNVENVLFVGAKMAKIQRFIATVPDSPEKV
jgi:hypothetical protein